MGTLLYSDPEPELIRLREFEVTVAPHVADAKVRSLRTQSLSYHRQRREAALFCHGIGSAMGAKVSYAFAESQDYDLVARWQRDDSRVFTPVQLKEFVPDELNSRGSLSRVLDSLAKYVDSKDLVDAIHVNRQMRVDFDHLTSLALPVAQIWLFGAVWPDQSKWMVYGNLLEEGVYHELGKAWGQA